MRLVPLGRYSNAIQDTEGSHKTQKAANVHFKCYLFHTETTIQNFLTLKRAPLLTLLNLIILHCISLFSIYSLSNFDFLKFYSND